jgi:ribosomal protein S18 acetylase RimI-like enzyme
VILATEIMEEPRVCINSPNEPPPLIRAGTADDVPALSALCMASFPGSPRWVLQSGERWWMKALASGAGELWVVDSFDGLQGFIFFVLDEHAWSRKMALTRWERIERVVGSLVKPTVLLNRVGEFLRPKTDHPADAPDNSLPQQDRLFVELISVSKQARGLGIGGKLVAFAQRRAAERNLRGTYYRVDRRNVPMIALMRSAGCRIVRKDQTGYLFSHLVAR